MNPPFLQKLMLMRSPFSAEKQLQRAIMDTLEPFGLTVSPEHRFDAENRIDFLVTDANGRRYGIEAKTACFRQTTIAQIHRYAAFVDEIILISTRAVNLKYPVVLCSADKIPVPLHIIETWKNL